MKPLRALVISRPTSLLTRRAALNRTVPRAAAAIAFPRLSSTTTDTSESRAEPEEERVYLPSPPPAYTPSASPKLAALHARLALHPSYSLHTLLRALTDRSAHPDIHFNNAPMATLGSSQLRYYTAEYLMVTYPRLPMPIFEAALDAYIGNAALAALGREWGLEAAFAPVADADAGLLRFKRLDPGAAVRPGTFNPHTGVSQEYAMATAVRSVFAGVFLHEGAEAAKSFWRHHVRSRKLDIERLFDFDQPTRELSRLCAREGFESPVARIIAETGRHSRNAVFVVGVYSGPELLGEGHGGSLDEARIRAAVNALKGWYLYSPVVKDVPSMTDGRPEAEARYRPAFVDVGDVIV
ncbi:60S ribosomal protein L3 [Geopyxis carbonaria]|nr:60S ribosomal protein L3 [Geopyxis carbonaria]